MIVRHPKAQAVFRPVTAYGRAAGASTSVMMRTRRRPTLRPTETSVWFVVLKPVLTAIASGQIVAFASTNRIAVSLSPKISIASGSTATPGSGFRTAVRNASTSAPNFDSVAKATRIAAITIPIPIPSKSRRSVVHVACARLPSFQPSQTASTACRGVAITSGPLCTAYRCQITTSTAATMPYRTAAGSRAHPSARGLDGVARASVDAAKALLLVECALLVHREQRAQVSSHPAVLHGLRPAELAHVDDLQHGRGRVPEHDDAVAEHERLLDRVRDEHHRDVRL